MKNLLLTLNLQFFADAFDDVDMDEIVQQTLQDEVPEADEVVEVDTDELVEDEIVEDETLEDADDDSAAPDLSNDDGRNEAFAEMRRERDRLAAEAAFIRQFAEDNGMTVEQLKEQYENQRIEKEAEAKGVPPEVLKRINTLEQENEQARAQAQSAKFNAEVQATMTKYSGKPQDFENVLKYANENGMLDSLRNGSISFEAAYKLANLDTMIEKAKRDAVQSDLATRKKRQQEAPLSAGKSSVPASNEDDIDALVEAITKETLEQGF